MINEERLRSLSRLPQPLLTVYVKTASAMASQHTPVPSYLTWLRKEADSLADNLPANERSTFCEQLYRVETFLHNRTPAENSLVILAGPMTWEIVPLRMEITNDLQWAKPGLSQLLWLFAEHRPYCVVVVDRSGVQFFGYRLREMTLLRETKFDVDISQWKQEDLGHVARPGIQTTYGSQRDVFEHRMDAQYKRLCRETAEQAIHLREKERFAAVFLVGSQRLITPIAAEFSQDLQRSIRLITKDLGNLDPHELQKHIEPEIGEWEREHEVTLVSELLGTERGAVVGIDETLAQLQKKHIRTLVVFKDLDTRLHRCRNCGWTDSSADPVCPVCQCERYVVTLHEVLPEMAAASEADVEVVSDKAAMKLSEAGGIGAWLRQPKQHGLSQKIAQER